MPLLFRTILVILIVACSAGLIGCSHEVGSEKWCDDMQAKPKKDWTVSEAANYAKHCVIRVEKK